MLTEKERMAFDALKSARAAFKVEYDKDGSVQSVSYGSEALRPLIVELDNAIANLEAAD